MHYSNFSLLTSIASYWGYWGDMLSRSLLLFDRKVRIMWRLLKKTKIGTRGNNAGIKTIGHWRSIQCIESIKSAINSDQSKSKTPLSSMSFNVASRYDASDWSGQDGVSTAYETTKLSLSQPQSLLNFIICNPFHLPIYFPFPCSFCSVLSLHLLSLFSCLLLCAVSRRRRSFFLLHTTQRRKICAPNTTSLQRTFLWHIIYFTCLLNLIPPPYSLIPLRVVSISGLSTTQPSSVG